MVASNLNICPNAVTNRVQNCPDTICAASCGANVGLNRKSASKAASWVDPTLHGKPRESSSGKKVKQSRTIYALCDHEGEHNSFVIQFHNKL